MAQSNSSDGLVNQSTALTARSNGFDSAQLSELTQYVAANFRRLVRTPIGLIFTAACSSRRALRFDYNNGMFGTNS
ncbi:hypothetical protein TorRG33x02_303400 [Trema orientale]|uniref:Uncharacterized protein n=1 Tax=Trema orientale TaxID=63057 RepID=A0A2P5BZ65_TREOI|nr:hypothetical protein TorRG33x02_303400 [Trema orientale]